MSDNNFINSVKFQKGEKGEENLFPPFRGGDEIVFGGEKEMQNLIEFYLKSKGDKDCKKNAERFKINCILGNNGGGKSRLFEGILDYEPNLEIKGPDLTAFGYPKRKNKLNISNMKEKNILLDNFSKNNIYIGKSVNYNIFNSISNNHFYCEILDFLNDYDKDIFSTFLNLKEDYSSLLKYDFNKDWYKRFKGEHIYFSELDNKENTRGFINSELDFKDTYEFFNILFDFLDGEKNAFETKYLEKIWLNTSDLFIYLLNESRERLMDFTTSSENAFFVKQKGYEYFKKSLIFLKYFLDLIKKYNLQEDYFQNSFSLKNNETKSLHLNKNEYFNEHDFEVLIGNTDKIIEIFNLLEEGNEDQSKVKVKEYFGTNLNYFLKKSSGYEQTYIDSSSFYILEILSSFKLKQKEIDNTYGLNFQLFIYYGVRNIFREEEIIDQKKCFISKMSKKEKKLLSFFIFDLDLYFLDINITKTFNNLSDGEKNTLSRFVNLYKTLSNDQYKKKKDFLILIDEPDLHLHLEWQKKYIKKLIDVFSILDTNIKLHFIIATHSPFLISDLATECVIKLDGKKSSTNKTDYTKIKTYNGTDINSEGNKGKGLKTIFEEEIKKGENKKTFGANFVDIINNGFFFDNKVLMGGFSEKIINNLSKVYKTKVLLDSYSIRDDNFKKNIELINLLLNKAGIISTNISTFEEYEKQTKIFTKIEAIKDNIGDDFLKKNLLYL